MVQKGGFLIHWVPAPSWPSTAALACGSPCSLRAASGGHPARAIPRRLQELPVDHFEHFSILQATAMLADVSVHLPSGYKPTDAEDFMNPLQVEYFRRKLLRNCSPPPGSIEIMFIKGLSIRAGSEPIRSILERSAW